MEQTTQQTIQKPSLPIKTKIAAWWIIVVGGLWVIAIIALLFLFAAVVTMGGLVFLGFLIPEFTFWFCIILLLPSILFLCSGSFLLKRKKWAWWFAIGVMGIGLVSWFMLIARSIRSFSFIICLVLFLVFLFTFFLLRRRWRFGTAIGVILLFLYQFLFDEGFIFFYYSIISLILFVPLILLLLDSKNFWKIAA